MADLSKVKLTSGEECNIKDAVAREVLGDLYPVLVDATAIPSNADLNTYTTPGSFYTTSGVASTLSNSGITTAGFKMIVMKCNKNSSYCWQIQIAVYGDCIIALRFYTGSAWSTWKRLTPA